MKEKNENSIKKEELLKKLKIKDKQKRIARQNDIENVKVMVRKYENEKIKEYKNNLPNILKEKNERLVEEAKTMMTKIGNSNLPLEPVIMRILNKELAGMGSQPMYNARELAIVFEYYQDMITELILAGVPFIPSRQNFAAFAGISANTFDSSYLKSNDLEKAKIAGAIEDYFIECSWSAAKRNKLNSYAVEKYNKIKGIGGGYVEPKVNLEIKQSNISIDSPEAMKEKLDELKKNLLNGDIDNSI